MAHNPQKGDRTYEEDYCSHYCREFDSRNLKMVLKSDNKHHSGMLKWPQIHIPCEMCAEPTLLIHDLEKCNRQFCSTACYHKLLGGKKRGMEPAFLLLSILKHRATYYPKTAEMRCERLADYMGRGHKQTNSFRVASMLKRWVASGIIIYIDRPSRKAGDYKFDLNRLGDTPLAKSMLDWVTMSYAERVAALSQPLNT